MSIGSTVKMLRARKGLTQAELARLVGVSQPRLSDIETGRYGEAHTLKTLKSLADALDAELIVKFKVRANGNSVKAQTLGQLQSQGHERDAESGTTDRSSTASA